MVIKIQKNSIQFDQLVNHLVRQFPKFKFWQIGDRKIKIEKNKFISAYITLKKDKILINWGFTHFKQYIGFALLLLVLGIVFPLLVFFVIVYPSIKKFLQQIADEIYGYYQHTVLNYSTYGKFDND